MEKNYVSELYHNIQSDIIKQYPINENIINMHKKPLHDEIDSLIKTLEIINGVKYDGYELIEDERKFDPYKVDDKYRKSKKKIDPILPIDKSRYSLMRFHFTLTGLDRKNNLKTESVTSELLILKHVNDFYFMKGGNRFYPIMQIVDSSTYTTKNTIVFKTGFNGVTICRSTKSITDIDGVEYTGQLFTILFCSKLVQVPLFYLSIMEPQKFIDFMIGQSNVIVPLRTDNHKIRENHSYFKLNKHVTLEVNNKSLQFDFIIEMILLLKSVVTTRTTWTEFNDMNYWITKLGSRYEQKKMNQYNKGLNVTISFRKALDEIVKNITKFDDIDKMSIYHITRHLIRHFNEFKSKNNLDLRTKRLRLSEHLLYHLNERISRHSNRLLNKKEVSLKNLKELVTFRRTELVSSIQKAQLVRDDNLVNDLNLFQISKYSIKGPNSMGGKKGAIPQIYRSFDPTDIGVKDLHDISSSDPGVTGMILPYANVDKDGFFSDNPEPNSYTKRMRESMGMKILDRKNPYKRKMIERIDSYYVK